MGTELQTAISFARDVETALREQHVALADLCAAWQVPEPKRGSPVVVDLAQLGSLDQKGRQPDAEERRPASGAADDDSMDSAEPADDAAVCGDKRYLVADPDNGPMTR
jgi:hypothetical protein